MTLQHHSDPSWSAAIREKSGVNPASCYQCGKCSAGCPMASETKYRPHDVMRLVATDRVERLFEDESIWLCLTCETCTARCPNDCDPARVIDAVREESVAMAPRSIGAFHRSFLDQVKINGRMFEIGLIVEYKLRTGKLFQDVDTAPALLTRGKLKPFPQRIRGLSDVRRIFERCAAERRDEEAKR